MPSVARCLQTAASKHSSQLKRARSALKSRYSESDLRALRVAARRARAVLELCAAVAPQTGTKRLDKSLRRITKATGALRDSDVQTEGLGKRIEHAPSEAERAALEAVLSRHQGKQMRRLQKVLGELEAIPLDHIRSSLKHSAKRAARRDAQSYAALVEGCLVPLVESALATLPDSDDDNRARKLHERRILVKNARYMLEILAPVTNESSAGIAARIKELQRLLGEIHDRALLIGELERNVRRFDKAGFEALSNGTRSALERLTAEQSEALGRLHEKLGQEQDTLRDELVAAFSENDSSGPGIASARREVQDQEVAVGQTA